MSGATGMPVWRRRFTVAPMLALAIAAILALVVAPLLGSADALAQAPPNTSVQVAGAVPTPKTFTAADLKALPRVTLSAPASMESPAAVYEGVAVADLLVAAGLEMGTALRGPRLATYLLVEARDGYRVVVALPELDAAFTDAKVILADTMDGAPINAEQGPFRLVIEGEKRPARWVRQVTVLRVVAAPAP